MPLLRRRKVVDAMAKKAKGTERKTRVLGLTDELGKFLMFGETSAANPASALNLYTQSTAVSVPINMVADTFCTVDPVLMFGEEMVQEHEVLDLLKEPSPHYSRESLLEMLAKDYLITGEMEIIGLGNVNRPPLEIQPMSPSSVSVTEGPGGIVGSFQVSGNTMPGVYKPVREGRRIRYFDGGLRELTQTRNFSTKNNSLLRGQSPLVAASKEARQHILGNQHNVSLLEKGGRVTLVFHFEEDLNDDDFEETRERVQLQYGGATEAGKIGVTAGGKLDVKELGINPKDMDWGNLQLIAQKSVALQYHVPLPLITDQRQTLNNYREGKLALYDDAVIPLSKRVFGGLGGFLLPRFGLDPTKVRIAMNPDDVSALVSRRNDELKKRREIGVETDNEIRKLMGREPYEGGDVVHKAANMIPVGTDLFTEDNDPGGEDKE
jgi:HK97 family phage portal protein